MRHCGRAVMCALLLPMGVLIAGCSRQLPPADAQAADDRGQQAAELEVTVTRIEIECEEAEVLPLNQTRMVIPGDEGALTTVSLVLEHSVCRYEEEFTSQGRTYERRGQAHLYELRSTDPEVPYVWALVSVGSPAYEVRLFAHGPGRNYLTWVRGGSVLFAEASKSEDRYHALRHRRDRRGAPEIFAADILELIKGDAFGFDAVQADIHVVSLGRNEAGEWVMKVHGTDPGTMFTLVSADGKTWQQQ